MKFEYRYKNQSYILIFFYNIRDKTYNNTKNIMSHGYGFLTESTLIPKKSKEIKINDNSGQILMESILKKQMQILKSGKKVEPTKKTNEPKRNAGVEQRMRKDEQADEKNKLVQKNYYRCLERKASVYDKVANKRINVDKLLVDFESKETEQSRKQAQQYEKQREAFYKGQIRNVQSQQKVLHQNIQTEKSAITELRERLTWQKDMWNEMRGETIEENQAKVLQSFDNKMTKQEREAFEKVLKEEETQKMKLEAIKRRKQIMEEERIKKLRKMNIIADVQQAAQVQRNPQKQQNEKQKQENNQE